jgi:hypothetical protein
LVVVYLHLDIPKDNVCRRASYVVEAQRLFAWISYPSIGSSHIFRFRNFGKVALKGTRAKNLMCC